MNVFVCQIMLSKKFTNSPQLKIKLGLLRLENINKGMFISKINEISNRCSSTSKDKVWKIFYTNINKH